MKGLLLRSKNKSISESIREWFWGPENRMVNGIEKWILNLLRKLKTVKSLSLLALACLEGGDSEEEVG